MTNRVEVVTNKFSDIYEFFTEKGNCPELGDKFNDMLGYILENWQQDETSVEDVKAMMLLKINSIDIDTMIDCINKLPVGSIPLAASKCVLANHKVQINCSQLSNWKSYANKYYKVMNSSF